MIYVKENKAIIMQANDNLSFGQVMLLVAEKWKILPEEDKTYYNDKAEDDKIRHNKE